MSKTLTTWALAGSPAHAFALPAYRRWGISPRPEDALIAGSTGWQSIQQSRETCSATHTDQADIPALNTEHPRDKPVPSNSSNRRSGTRDILRRGHVPTRRRFRFQRHAKRACFGVSGIAQCVRLVGVEYVRSNVFGARQPASKHVS